MCVCVGVVLSLTHIQFVAAAAAAAAALFSSSCFYLSRSFCSFAATWLKFSVSVDFLLKKDSYQSCKKNADFFMLR